MCNLSILNLLRRDFKLATDSRDDETTKDKSVTCYEYKILCGPKHENSKYHMWAFSSSGSICSKSG